ncbi:MAG: response regulator transcription factor [Geminicoccaceae bacterium]
MTESMRVLIVDDHPIVRGGCRRLLQQAALPMELHEAADGHEALRLNGQLRPDLVILDLNLPGIGGLDLLRRLLEANPAARCLIFSMYEDPILTARALEAGALGYVTKNDKPERLLEAVAQVMQGEVYLSRQVAQKLALINLQLKSNPLQGLSSRELAILELLGAGRSLAEIAGRLQVSYRTVANITAQLRKKLQVPTTAALIRLAVEHHPQRLQPEAEM